MDVTSNSQTAATGAQRVKRAQLGMEMHPGSRSRRRARLLRVQHDPPGWSAEAHAIADEDRRAVLAAVARLPSRQRQVLALRYYLDLAENEIAASLRISRGTVSSTTSWALAALADELREEL